MSISSSNLGFCPAWIPMMASIMRDLMRRSSLERRASLSAMGVAIMLAIMAP